MNPQHTIHTQKRTVLLMLLLLTCAVALSGGKVALAKPTVASLKPVGGLRQVQNAARTNLRIAPVNTSGVVALKGSLMQVDESDHVVNAKGFRAGGRTQDS